MRYVARSLFLTVFIMACVYATAEAESAPSIKSSISRKRILIGDRIRYRIEIVSREDLEIEPPQFKDSKIGDCEIKDSGKSVKKSMFGNRIYENWLYMTSYYVGKRVIPAIEIKYRKKGDKDWSKIKTAEFVFTVETVLPREARLTDVKDIKDILYPFSWFKLFIQIVAAALLLGIIVLIVFKLLFKKAPPKLPHETALEEIDAAMKLFFAGADVKDYYVRISDAVRRYIENVFSLKAPEMTTQEFLISLGGSSKLQAAHKDLLAMFMQACDLVKFAKYNPGRSDIDNLSVAAKKFIEESKEVYTKKEVNP
jgi:hypothetical protein